MTTEAHNGLAIPPVPLDAGDAYTLQLDLCLRAAEADTCSGVQCSGCMYNKRNLSAFRAFLVRGAGVKGGE